MKRRMLGAAAFGLGAALLVAGCGAGQITQTDTQKAAINGASAQVKKIAIRDAELAYPEGTKPAGYAEGTNADVMLSIINNGSENDQLVSASSEDAESVSIKGDKLVPFGKTLAVGPDEPAVPKVLHAQIVVEGFKHQVRPGQTIHVTLTFQKAGSVKVELPIAAPEEPRSGAEHGEPSGGEHGGQQEAEGGGH